MRETSKKQLLAAKNCFCDFPNLSYTCSLEQKADVILARESDSPLNRAKSLLRQEPSDDSPTAMSTAECRNSEKVF
jgi:hypothetical protein